MSYETLIFDVASDVASIRLNRPKSANGINLLMVKELTDAAQVCHERSVRCVLISGEGKFFSVGGDLDSFAADIDRLPRLLSQLTHYLHTAISRLAYLDAPVIAAVNGPCAGAGMSLACSCDFVLAAESSSFTMAYTGAGLSPDGSSTWFLPRRIGELRARELMITNRTLSAAESVDWGLANRLVADNSLGVEARMLAKKLSMGPTRAYGKVKSLLNESLSTGLETQMERESRCIGFLADTADAREGIDAFLKKRKPSYTGQ